MSLYPYTSPTKLHKIVDKGISAIKNHKDATLKGQFEIYETIYNEVPCYITIQDNNFQILNANKKALKDFGNIIGKYCYEVYNNTEKPCYACKIEKLDYNEDAYISEHNVIKNEENVCLLLKAIPLFNSRHQLTHIIEIAEDITRLKQAERFSIINETISGITHNIKNIISLMDAGSYIVDTGLLHGEQEKIKNGWSIIQKNISRLSDTVVSLINYTKDKPYTFQPVKINKLIENIVNTVKDRATNEHVRIKVSLDKDIHTVNGDEDDLYHAILNLINNAIDACMMDDKKKPNYLVCISSKDHEGTGCFITVKDNGCGISEKNKNKIFKSAFTTKPGKGTGLGLLITQKTITGHKGMINFDSSRQGTTFSIYLPYRRY